MSAEDEGTVVTKNVRSYRGPLKNRSCTDIPCLVLFAAAIICWISLSIYAAIYGDYKNIIKPRDSHGKQCGIDEDVRDKPFLMFFDISKCSSGTCHTTQVCVDKCPSTAWTFPGAQLELRGNSTLEDLRNSMICENYVDLAGKNEHELAHLVQAEICAEWYVPSMPILNRCIPLEDKTKPEEIQQMIENRTVLSTDAFLSEMMRAESVLVKIKSSALEVCLFILGSVFICLIYIALLRWIALPCVATGIIALIAVLCFFSYLCFEGYRRVENSNGWLILCVLSGIAAISTAVLSACMMTRIFLACKLIAEAGKAIMHTLTSLFFPIVPWLVQFGLIACAIFTFLQLKSLGQPHFRIVENSKNGNCMCSSTIDITQGAVCNPEEFLNGCSEDNDYCISISCRMDGMRSTSFHYFLYLYHFAVLFWAYCFVTALGEMILAGTFATWYWKFQKTNVPWFTITVSAGRTIRYHLGTVAFGSVLITFCEIFKILLKFLYHKIMRHNPDCQQFCRVVYQISKWVVAFLEKFLKFMNRNAYIMCAIRGTNLCTSATNALNLLTRNFLRVLVLNNIVDVLVWLGKVVVMGIMVSSSWWYFNLDKFQTNSIDRDFWYVPVIFVGIGSYVVVNVFFVVLSTAVNTIFLCFLEDSEINDGSVNKPYYMSRDLGKLLLL